MDILQSVPVKSSNSSSKMKQGYDVDGDLDQPSVLVPSESSCSLEFMAESDAVKVGCKEVCVSDQSSASLNVADSDDQYRKEKEEEILKQQAEEQSRYDQLLILMQKSDLFVKMIFQRMEESKIAAERKMKKLASPTRKRKRAAKAPRGLAKKRRRIEDEDEDEAAQDLELYEESESDGTQMGDILFSGGSLREYQVEGRNWLNTLYENGISGILADEMGLGKTVQVIGAIAKMIESGVRGPFLIVAPLSTLPNWSNEFARFTPEIPVILYHAQKDDRVDLRRKIGNSKNLPGKLNCYPVLITSYDIIRNDCKELRWKNWKMLVVDEGHRLKNHNCLLLKALRTINCSHRLLLTGTPLQNNLAELWSLLNFCLPEIFNNLKTFEEWFSHDSLLNENDRDKIIAQEKEKRVIGLMHQILTPFMLRRLKTDVELTIPPKREIILHAPLTAYQKKLYDQAVDGSIEQLVIKKKEPYDDDIASRSQRHSRFNVNYSEFDGEDSTNESKFLAALENLTSNEPESCAMKKEEAIPKYAYHIRLQNLMMITRRITNHGHMVEYPLDDEGEYCLDERLLNHSGKIQVLDRLLRLLREGKHKVLLFSQFTSMLDILQDFCNYSGFKYSRLDGTMSLQDRSNQMKWFAEEEDIFIFMISTRAGGLGLNLVAADTVIFYDSDWNPQQDIQAQDRCHRIGQTKPVLVFRLLIPNTIEDKIYQYACGKRTLERLIIHGDCFKKSLQSRDQWNGKKFVISDFELKKLLSCKEYQTSATMKLIDEESLKKHLDRSDLWKEWNGETN